MSHISKPKVHHPSLQRNALGLTRRDYEGALTTLCAGCGHDSITAALIQAFWELDTEPYKVAKFSGIGCSSKTPAYFLKESHGFNSVHGRMPAVAAGAGAANPELTLIGVSGDGDSLSIGLGQLCHAIRRNVNLTYVLENNGVYGLTKGQFSASADPGSTSKRGAENTMAAIDSVLLAINLGATFVARSFSGDKEQLVPILKAAIVHKGFALIDVISPCVTFNDHEGSTKSYAHVRKSQIEVIQTDYVPHREEITVEYGPGAQQLVDLHGGGHVLLRKVDENYDPTDRDRAYAYVRERIGQGELVTGLLYVTDCAKDMVEQANSLPGSLTNLPFSDLCPGQDELQKLMGRYR